LANGILIWSLNNYFHLRPEISVFVFGILDELGDLLPAFLDLKGLKRNVVNVDRVGWLLEDGLANVRAVLVGRVEERRVLANEEVQKMLERVLSVEHRGLSSGDVVALLDEGVERWVLLWLGTPLLQHQGFFVVFLQLLQIFRAKKSLRSIAPSQTGVILELGLCHPSPRRLADGSTIWFFSERKSVLLSPLGFR